MTAINLGGPGVVADRDWRPLIETPPHPDHPSGHATDCWTAALVLQGIFGPEAGPVRYPGTGQPDLTHRPFARVIDSAEECAMSRLWAGVHFRLANEEGARLAGEIARRALAAVPPLRPRGPPGK